MSTNAEKIVPLKSVLIAVNDVKVARDIVTVLKDDFGITNVKVVRDGVAAWAELKDGAIDGLIMDLDMEKLSSMAILARIRQNTKTQFMPITVVCKGSPKERLGLFKDNPPTAIIDGSFSPTAFSMKFDTLIKEYALYRDDEPVLGQVVAKAKTDAKKSFDEIVAYGKSSPNSVPVLNIAAQRLFDAKLFQEAEAFANAILKLNDQNGYALLMLARVHLVSGRFGQGLISLGAHKYSIKDVRQLVLAAELNFGDKKIDEAKRFFTSAAEIDSENIRAKGGVVVTTRILKTLAASKDAPPSTLVGLLRLAANAEVKDEQPEVRIAFYQTAIEFAPGMLGQAQVTYDLGMYYLDSKKPQDALICFKKAVALGGDKIPEAADQVKKLSTKPK